MTQYYVSKGSSNGFAIGSDSNSGLTKSAPFLTISRLLAVAANGDSATINDGVYSGAELSASNYLNMTSKLISMAAQNDYAVTIVPTVTTACMRFNTPPAGGSATFSGIIFDATSASANYGVQADSTGGALYTIVMTNCKFVQPVFYGLNVLATAIDLTLNNCDMTGSGNRRLVDAAVLANTSKVTINGGSCVLTGVSTAGAHGVNLKATGTGVTAAVRNFTVNATLGSTLTGNGQHNGIQISNIPAVVVEDNNVTVIGYYGTRTSAPIWVTSDLAVTSARPVVRRNTVRNGTTGGYLIIIGSDATTTGDNQTNESQVYGNTCSADYYNASTPVHGILTGFCTGGLVWGNRITGAGIALLSKQQTAGAKMFSNILEGAGAQFMRAKGSVNTQFAHNTCIALPGFSGTIMQSDNDSATNSTGIQYWNNLVDLTAAQPTLLVSVAASSTASFDNNQYVGTIPANAFSYQGAVTDGLTAWNATATVGTEVNAAAGFFGTGSGAEQYKLLTTSAAYGTGKRPYLSNQPVEFADYLGYRRPANPCRGAWDVASMSVAATRLARSG